MPEPGPWFTREFGLEELKKAAALDEGYKLRSGREMPEHQPASVLILFSPGGRELLLTQRTETVETHKGQFAFPGGRQETGETAEQAVLRETFEEVGIYPRDVHLAGHLPPLITVTGYRVTPFLAMAARPPESIRLIAQVEETADVFWASTAELFSPSAYREERVQYKGLLHPVDVFYLGHRRIWGATATMLANTAGRLAQLLR